MDDIFEKDEDIDALLNPASIRPKTERDSLVKIEADNLEEGIIDEGNDILQKSNDAVSETLIAIQSSPDDAHLISAAAALLKAHTSMLAEMNKISMLKEKLKQQEKLQKMKSVTNLSISKMNNETKQLVSREEALKRARKKNKVVDAEVVKEDQPEESHGEEQS